MSTTTKSTRETKEVTLQSGQATVTADFSGSLIGDVSNCLYGVFDVTDLRIQSISGQTVTLAATAPGADKTVYVTVEGHPHLLA